MNFLRLALFIMLCLGSLLSAQTAYADDVITIPQENKQDDEKTRPRMPAYSPVYCQVGADHVTFFCRYEAVGEIEVSDADGTVIATAVAELSAGYTVLLPGGVTPGMTLTVTIGGVTYSATI